LLAAHKSNEIGAKFSPPHNASRSAISHLLKRKKKFPEKYFSPLI
jgi:hypothetical protein